MRVRQGSPAFTSPEALCVAALIPRAPCSPQQADCLQGPDGVLQENGPFSAPGPALGVSSKELKDTHTRV